MAVFSWEKKGVCKVVTNFGGFGGVCRRGGCFGVLVEHIVATKPYGACEGVESFEGEVCVIVSAFNVRLGVVEWRL